MTEVFVEQPLASPGSAKYNNNLDQISFKSDEASISKCAGRRMLQYAK